MPIWPGVSICSFGTACSVLSYDFRSSEVSLSTIVNEAKGPPFTDLRYAIIVVFSWRVGMIFGYWTPGRVLMNLGLRSRNLSF